MARATAIESSLPPPPGPELEDEEAPEDQDAPIGDEDEGEIERQARAQGWHPREEFNGPPERWVPAKEFLEIGNLRPQVQRENNRRLVERNLALKGTVDHMSDEMKVMSATLQKQTEAIDALRKLAQTANEKGYQRALAELKAKQRAAAVEGDVATYDAVTEQIEETEGARAEATATPPAPAVRAEPEPPKPPTPPQPQVRQEVVDFVNANPWFSTDPELNKRMIAEHKYLQSLYSEDELPLADNLEEAKKRVVAAFPAKFRRPNGNGAEPPAQPQARPRRPAAPVSAPSGGRERAPPQRGLSIASIADPTERAEARAAYDSIRRGTPDYTEAEYMAVYENPHTDILAVRENLRSKPSGR